MLKTILSVSGRSGLFKLISRAKNMLIVESLSDNKRLPIYGNQKVMALSDISVYTQTEEISLAKVFQTIFGKENGGTTSLDTVAANPIELRTYLEDILPNFDRNRVYPTDIRKILIWYNTLVAAGLTEFNSADQTQEDASGNESGEINDNISDTQEVNNEQQPIG
jgi:hypothetical protein